MPFRSLKGQTSNLGRSDMQTANLQLEGLYLVMASLVAALRDKGLLNAQEIEKALAAAEACCTEEAGRLSPSHLEAVRFPARFLRAAMEASTSQRPLSFGTLAALVGETKDGPPRQGE